MSPVKSYEEIERERERENVYCKACERRERESLVCVTTWGVRLIQLGTRPAQKIYGQQRETHFLFSISFPSSSLRHVQLCWQPHPASIDDYVSEREEEKKKEFFLLLLVEALDVTGISAQVVFYISSSISSRPERAAAAAAAAAQEGKPSKDRPSSQERCASLSSATFSFFFWK